MDWLSPVVSGVVGLGGLALAWRTLTSTREHEVARWYGERRADAYVELLEVAEDISLAAATEALRAAEVLTTPRPEGIRLGEDAVDRYTDARDAERLARTALDRAI